MNDVHERRIAPRVAALAAAVAVLLTACGDDPFAFQWSDTPKNGVLYSLARPELNTPSGFSFYEGIAYVVESPTATGRWDAALDTQDGQLVLLPPGALGITTARARVAIYYETAYEDVTQATADTTLYVADEPVPVVPGAIYIIRTNLRPGSFGSACTYYAKMEPLEIDVVEGILRFRYITSPICNSRDLVPPN